MIKGGTGGSNTQTGLLYEAKTDLKVFLNSKEGYKVEGTRVFYHGDLVARFFKKHELYGFLKSNNIDWKQHISKKLLPDGCIYVIVNNTVFIIEVKYQQVSGSVDEKLQTCDFKRKEYIKLFSKLNYKVEYCYVLNDWFLQEEYKDVLDYVISVNCRYYFTYIPLHEFGLPVPQETPEDDVIPSYEM